MNNFLYNYKLWKKLRNFWKLVKLNPEESYKYFYDHKDVWSIVITDFGKKVLNTLQKTKSEDKLIGPFKLYVPSIGKTVLIYGKDGFYQSDQDNLISLLSNKEKIINERTNTSEEYKSLYDYYRIQYPKDLEIFSNACVWDIPTKKPEDKMFNVADLDNLRKKNHYLLKKKHFMYFLAIHTAYLMVVHKHFNDKYEEFRNVNKSMVFEYGLTNTFMYPWEILTRCHLSFDKELFTDCLGWVMSKMMTDYYFCGIIPRDFMDKFIDDPDLNNPKTPYGKDWKEIVTEQWFQVVKSICPKIK